VRGLGYIEVPIVIRQDRAAYGCYPYDLLAYPEFIYDLADEPMDYAVAAAGAIMGLDIL
jgi:hypothetical protein